MSFQFFFDDMGVGGWVELYPNFFLDFWNCFNFAKPLNKYRLTCEDIVKTSHHSYLGVEIQMTLNGVCMLKTVPKRQMEPLDLCDDILVGARNQRHYTQLWLDLTWNMHLGHGTLVSKRI